MIAAAPSVPQIETSQIQYYHRHWEPPDVAAAALSGPRRPRARLHGRAITYTDLQIRLPVEAEPGFHGPPGPFSNCTVPLVLFQHWYVRAGQYCLHFT